MCDKVHMVDVLMIEDNPGDVRLVQEALKDTRPMTNLHVASSGEEAWTFLQQKDQHLHAPRPSLILLDLNLQGMSGLELLDLLNKKDNLRSIPVVVLTSSAAVSDVLAAYEHHANCYVTKPATLESFLNVVRKLGDFWLASVTLPPDTQAS
jgi:two-component system, chemotaxis family, response regulator Rcp1